MQQFLEANWIIVAVAALAIFIVLWLLPRSRKAARQRSYRPDVLDEGVGPAARNQALIDAPSAATAALAASGPDIFAGAGEAIAMGAAEQVAQATEIEAASAAGEADDLSRIKGVGPKLVALLTSLGVVRYAQIAAWDEADLTRIDAQLGAFAGRPKRDSWVEQCRFLAAGDTSGFEGKFGKL